MVWIPIKVFITMVWFYENHWALSENTVARGYDIGYARTFKNARWARVHADHYNWRGREAVKVGYYKLPKRDAIKGFKVGAEFILHHILLLMRVIKQRLII